MVNLTLPMASSSEAACQLYLYLYIDCRYDKLTWRCEGVVEGFEEDVLG